MFNCKIENSSGDILTLTQNESNYQILSIKGLNPPSAIINTSSVTSIDGTKFNSSKLESRNIVITIKVNGDVEGNRLLLYNYFKTKEFCKFYYQNSHRNVSIDCYVESIECDLFTNNEVMQISLLCPSPYFRDLEIIYNDISKVVKLFKFPFSLNAIGVEFSNYNDTMTTDVFNNSETENGVIVRVKFKSAANSLEIKNTTSGDFFKLNYNFQENDFLTLNTNKGEKSVVCLRNGDLINMFPYITVNSTFFQLRPAHNLFGYLINNDFYDDVIDIEFEHSNIYRGV